MGTTHSKYAVFDRRWAIVGSHNLDPRSEKLNSESAIAFESQSLASDLAATFFERDLGFARSISLQAAQSFGDTGDVRYQLRKNFGNLFERHL